MRLRIVLVLLAATLFTVGAFAQTKPGAKISMQQARTTALQRHQGTIKSAELEKEHGRMVYSFDIQTTNGIHEVQVDANSGKIVEDSKESAADEAREAAQEGKKAAAPASATHKPGPQ